MIDKTTLRNPCHYKKSKFEYLDLREWENIIKRCKINIEFLGEIMVKHFRKLPKFLQVPGVLS